MKRLTNKEIARQAGRSVTWLRTHECRWCGQSILYAIKDGCGAIYEKCDPLEAQRQWLAKQPKRKAEVCGDSPDEASQ